MIRVHPAIWITAGMGAAICVWLVVRDRGCVEQISGEDLLELPQAAVGAPYSAILMRGVGTTPVAWRVKAGSLPTGLMLDRTSGRIAGVPVRDGRYSFVLKERGSTGCGELHRFAITVQNLPPLAVAPTWNHPTATRGASYTATLVASGGWQPYRWSIEGSLPSGLTINPNTGGISGTPLLEGNYNFVAHVRDGQRQSAQRTFNLVVVAPNRAGPDAAPRLAIAGKWPDRPLMRGERFSTALEATGGSGALLWSVRGSLPPGLAMSPGQGFIDGVLTRAGTFRFQVSVKDHDGRFAERAYILVVQEPKPEKPPCDPFNLSAYSQARSGTLVWTGMMSPAGRLEIGTRAVSLGVLKGVRPPYAVPVRITILDGDVRMTSSPSPGDCWTGPIVLWSRSRDMLKSIAIRWSVYQP
jgi:hypothetical protein